MLTINSPSGMCFVKVQVGVFTGVDPNTKPGVSIEVEPYPQLTESLPVYKDAISERLKVGLRMGGVIGRDDVKRLHSELGRFLEQNPPQ